MKQWIKAISTGAKGSRNLTYDEAVYAAHMIARGEATEAQIAAFLMAETMKAESDDELVAFIDVFRKYGLPFASFSDSLNLAGPYEGRNYFPISLPVSLLLASVGFPQMLHSSDSLPPIQGISMKDVLQELGIKLDLHEQQWEYLFSELHIGFIWTEHICPPLRRVRQVREQIGLRTILHTVEKLINPLHSMNLMIGVRHRTEMDPLIRILPRAGFENVYIVLGVDGSEDVPIYKNSIVRRVTPYGDESTIIDPQKFGFGGPPLQKHSKELQLELLLRIVDGDTSPEIKCERDHVIFNAGLRLFWFDKVASYEEGFHLARTLLQRQEGKKLLRRWIEKSNWNGKSVGPGSI